MKQVYEGKVVFLDNHLAEVAVGREHGSLIFWRGADAVAFYPKPKRVYLKRAKRLLDKHGEKYGKNESNYTTRRALLIILDERNSGSSENHLAKGVKLVSKGQTVSVKQEEEGKQ